MKYQHQNFIQATTQPEPVAANAFLSTDFPAIRVSLRTATHVAGLSKSDSGTLKPNNLEELALCARRVASGLRVGIRSYIAATSRSYIQIPKSKIVKVAAAPVVQNATARVSSTA